MIIYDLICDCGGQFEGWFNDFEDYQDQNNNGLLSCPVCSGNCVHKILSPVAVKTKNSSLDVTYRQSGDVHVPSKENDASQLLEYIKGVKKFVDENYDDVGSSLAGEALKIHYGVNKPRNIRGVATLQEEKMLNDEGIEILKIPFPSSEGEKED